MEMDLAPFYGTIFHWEPIGYVFLLSSPGVFLWFSNKSLWVKHGSLQVLIQSCSRVWLDTALVAGISLTCLGMLGMILGMKDFTKLYSTTTTALLTFLWGGILTGVGHSLYRKEIKLSCRLNLWQILLFLVVSLLVIRRVLNDTGNPEMILELSLFLSKYYLPCFLIVFAAGYNGAKSKILLANNANLVATLGGMAFGIALWFLEGADYMGSLDAIYLVSTILTIGCLTYIVLYVFALYHGVNQRGSYQTKSWHFAEAATFFLFLVYAPVGATEYFRESADQANQQANNEAQELRIEQLEAQIKLLTEKVGEV